VPGDTLAEARLPGVLARERLTMIVVYCQTRAAANRAELAMVGGLKDQPGILLVNTLVTTGWRTRELDGIWVHPRGIIAIEAKGVRQSGTLHTSANGPWMVGGATLDLASGPNPILQARTGAQSLRAALTAADVNAGFIPAVVVLSGTGLTLSPHTVADSPVLLVQDLPALASLVRGHDIGAELVRSVLAALDITTDPPTDEELLAEGFVAGSRPVPSPPPAGGGRPAQTRQAGGRPPRAPAEERRVSERRAAENVARPAAKGERRARRVGDLEESARVDWRRSNRRLLVTCGLVMVALGFYLPTLPAFAVAIGALAAGLSGAYQWSVRARYSGLRDEGPLAVAGWLLSLVPYVGIGSSVAWVSTLNTLDAGSWPFVVMLSVLISAGMTAAIHSGRSSFVHPPAHVIERLDHAGQPTGAFALANTRPLGYGKSDFTLTRGGRGDHDEPDHEGPTASS